MLEKRALRIQHSAKTVHRKGRKERKGRGLAISNWRLAFVACSSALGYTERVKPGRTKRAQRFKGFGSESLHEMIFSLRSLRPLR
jgi:hypothetical protein